LQGEGDTTGLVHDGRMLSRLASCISLNLCSRRSINCLFNSALVFARPHLGLGVTGLADDVTATVNSLPDVKTSVLLSLPDTTTLVVVIEAVITPVELADDKALLKSTADILLQSST